MILCHIALQKNLNCDQCIGINNKLHFVYIVKITAGSWKTKFTSSE